MVFTVNLCHLSKNQKLFEMTMTLVVDQTAAAVVLQCLFGNKLDHHGYKRAHGRRVRPSVCVGVSDESDVMVTCARLLGGGWRLITHPKVDFSSPPCMHYYVVLTKSPITNGKSASFLLRVLLKRVHYVLEWAQIHQNDQIKLQVRIWMSNTTL